MEWFLRQQAEKLEEKKVSVREPALASPVVYFSTWRTTSSDVLSLVTTATPFSRPATWDVDGSAASPTPLPPAAGVPTRRQPPTPAPFRESKFYSPLCVDGAVNDLERATTNKALWQEREKFLTRLRARRIDREILETAAAVKIQALCRGIVTRAQMEQQSRLALARSRLRKSYNSVVVKLRVKKFVESNVTETRGRAGDAVVKIQRHWRRRLGMRCAAKERHSQREELLNWASTRLQRMVRKRFAWRATAKLRMRQYEAVRAQSSQAVQKLARKAAARKVILRRQLLLQYVAAVAVQRCARKHLARKACRNVRALASVLRVNAAAIPIQAIFRGQLHRRCVVACVRAVGERVGALVVCCTGTAVVFSPRRRRRRVSGGRWGWQRAAMSIAAVAYLGCGFAAWWWWSASSSCTHSTSLAPAPAQLCSCLSALAPSSLLRCADRYVRVLRTQEKKDLIFAAALSVQRVYRGHLGRCEFRAERSRSDMEHTVGACIRVRCQSSTML
jgi:hypothetical protein